MTMSAGGGLRSVWDRVVVIGATMGVGACVFAICRAAGWEIDTRMLRANLALVMAAAWLVWWAIRSIMDRLRGVTPRWSPGDARAVMARRAGGHMAAGLIALGCSLALFVAISPHSGPQADLVAISVGVTTAGIWLGIWTMARRRKRAPAAVEDVPRIPAATFEAAPDLSLAARQPVAVSAAPARVGRPKVLRHLHDRDGGIFYSAEVDADLPEERVAQTLWNACLRDGAFRDGRRGKADFQNVHIRGAVFMNFDFSSLEIEDCIFEDVLFDGVWSAANWHLRRCRVERCRFVGSAMQRSNIKDCTFIDVDMTEVYIAGDFDDCTLTNVGFSLDGRDLSMTVGLSGSTLNDVLFAGADIPEVRGLYGRVHAEIVRHGGEAPRHAAPWLYNILTAVLGDTWRRLAERHGIWTAFHLLFYYNSVETRLIPVAAGGQAVLEHIRVGARVEAGGARTILRHLYDVDGGIFYSAELPADLPETRVAEALWGASLRDKAFRASRKGPHFKRLHVRDAVFGPLSLDNLDIVDCVFDNVHFEDVSCFASWELRRCTLRGCSFRGQALLGTTIADCTFVDVDMSEINLVAHVERCDMTGLRVKLGDDGQGTVYWEDTTLRNVVFVGAQIPEVPKIYSKVYAEIVSRGERAPDHVIEWLYNLLTAVLGDAWRRTVERHGIWTAMSLTFYCNSADTRFLPVAEGGQAVLDYIRVRAAAEQAQGE